MATLPQPKKRPQKFVPDAVRRLRIRLGWPAVPPELAGPAPKDDSSHSDSSSDDSFVEVVPNVYRHSRKHMGKGKGKDTLKASQAEGAESDSSFEEIGKGKGKHTSNTVQAESIESDSSFEAIEPGKGVYRHSCKHKGKGTGKDTLKAPTAETEAKALKALQAESEAQALTTLTAESEANALKADSDTEL